MFYRSLPKRTVGNLLNLYRDSISVEVFNKSIQYEFVEVHRNNKVFYQYRQVGKLIPKWVDTKEHQMIMDAGTMTEQDWSKKYEGHDHKEYKSIHQAFAKHKKSQEQNNQARKHVDGKLKLVTSFNVQ